MNGDNISLAIRGFCGRTIVFSDRVSLPPKALEKLMPQLAEKHAAAMAKGVLTMIEIEFLDEPDEQQRFFRFGVDAGMMVNPIQMTDENSVDELIRQRWGKG